MILDPETEFINHLAYSEEILREGLSEELLITPLAKRIYSFVLNYVRNGQRPTIEVLETEFNDVEFEEPKSSVEWIIEKLKTRYKSNELWALVSELAENQNDPNGAFEILRNKSLEIEKKSLSHRNILSLKDYNIFLSEFQDDILNKGLYKKFSFGFKEIDDYTGGHHPGQLAVIAARPKCLKTFMMLKAFIEQIKEGNIPVFFTLENTDKEIMNRLQCLISKYSWDLAMKGDIQSTSDWEFLKKQWEKFIKNRQGFIVQPLPEERTVSQLMLTVEKLEANSIFISQLKYIQPQKNYKNYFETYNEIITDLKQAALTKELPIILEAQLNREAQKKDNSELDLGQLGLTDSIGQTADVIFGLVKTEAHESTQTIEMGIIESRNYAKKSWLFGVNFKERTEIKILAEE